MWIYLTILMVVLLGCTEGFHLQNQAGVRIAVCRRAPPCCPGHVCRAYQRFDASRPVAACARSLDGRPLYAPGSQAQQRICGAGSLSQAGIGSRSLPSPSGQPVTRGQRQFRRRRGPGFDVNPVLGQSQAGTRPGGRIRGIGMEGDRLGSASHLSWDQGRTQRLPRFPGQTRRIPGQGQGMLSQGQGMLGQGQGMLGQGQGMLGQGQSMLGQGQMGLPEFPPMPSFGDQLSQQGLFPPGLSPEPSLGSPPNTFASLPGRQGQRSFSGMGEQRLELGQSLRGQGQSDFGGQFPAGQSFQAGQPIGGTQASFDQGQIDFSSPQSSFSGQSFSSQTLSGSPVGGRSIGGQSFGGQSFSGASFGQLAGSAGGGRAPQPFLVEQPPISATSIGQDQGHTSGTSQQP